MRSQKVSSTSRFLRGGEKYYITFAHTCNSLPFPKELQNPLTVDEVIAKSSSPRSFEHM